jgi:hypothetical protein
MRRWCCWSSLSVWAGALSVLFSFAFAATANSQVGKPAPLHVQGNEMHATCDAFLPLCAANSGLTDLPADLRLTWVADGEVET